MSQYAQQGHENPNYSVGQTWGALKKAWRGFKIARSQSDIPKMAEYAKKIRSLQRDLGVYQSNFPGLDIR